MRDPLAELLDGMLTAQDAIRRSTAWVETKADPETPGLTVYRITGTRKAVQAAIDARMWEIEEQGGSASFAHPVRRIGGDYVSTGYTLRTQEVAQ